MTDLSRPGTDLLVVDAPLVNERLLRGSTQNFPYEDTNTGLVNHSLYMVVHGYFECSWRRLSRNRRGNIDMRVPSFGGTLDCLLAAPTAEADNKAGLTYLQAELR